MLVLLCPIASGADQKLEFGQPSAGAMHHLILGFNVGFLDHVDNYAPALRRIKKDGFSHVRVYFPWTKKSNSNEQIIAQIKKIVDLGFAPLLGLSDFPYELKTDDKKNARWRRTLNPRQENVVSRREKYINLYPPEDLNLYAGKLDGLIATAVRAFGEKKLENWRFEIGNEPNAPVFFWGGFPEFKQVLDISLNTIHRANPAFVVGGCGFTTRILTEANRNQNYLSLIDDMAVDSRVDFISFHIYENVFAGESDLAQRMGVFIGNLHGKDVVISEWNVEVEPRKAAVILESPDFMNHLIYMVYNCYVDRVSALYVHKLMDNPAAEGSQLGLIGADGTPKASYNYFLEIKNVVDAGFYAERRDGAVILRGGNSLVVMAENRLNLDLSGMKIIDGSVEVNGPVVAMEPGTWLVASWGK